MPRCEKKSWVGKVGKHLTDCETHATLNIRREGKGRRKTKLKISCLYIIDKWEMMENLQIINKGDKKVDKWNNLCPNVGKCQEKC